MLAILVMVSAVLGWLGGLVTWLMVLGALAVFAFCLLARPDPGLLLRNGPRSCPFSHKLGPGRVHIGWKPCACVPAAEGPGRGWAMSGDQDLSWRLYA